MTEVILDR